MAPSKQADFLRALYQDRTGRMVADPNLSIANLRSMFDEWSQAALEPENVTYNSDHVGGVEAIWALPSGADTSRVIIYSDSEAIHAKAKAKGVKTVLSVVPCMQHVFPALSGRAPEADQELGRIAAWYKGL